MDRSLDSFSDEELMAIANQTGDNAQSNQPEPFSHFSDEELMAAIAAQSKPKKQPGLFRNTAAGLTSGAYNNIRSLAGLFGAELDPIAPFGADPDSLTFKNSQLIGEWGTPGGVALGALKFAPKVLKVLTPFLKKSRADKTRAVALGALLQPNVLPGIATGTYESIQNLPGMADRLPDHTFGGDENSLRYQAGRIGGHILAPGIAAVKAAGGAQRMMPFISSPAAMGLGGAVAGGAFTPGEAEDRAVGSVLGGLTGYGLGKGAQRIGKNKDFLIPSRFEKKTQEALNDILQGYQPTRAGENEKIFNAVNKTYKQNKATAHSSYENIKKQADERGFNGSDLKIKNSIFEKRSELAQDPKTFSKFTDFVYSPSFRNAHELQSMMGKRGMVLTKSKDGKDRLIGGEILKLRNELIKDIEQSFTENGSSDLAKSYKKATAFHKKNVVPYRSTVDLQKIASSNPDLGSFKYPKNALETFSDNTNEMKTVLEQMPPEAKRALLARMLDKSKDAEDLYQIGPLKQRVNAIKKSGEIDMVNPEDMEKLKAFIEKAKKLEKTRNAIDFLNKTILKKATRYLGI